MKLFDSVVIGCDTSPDRIKDAAAIRAVLETFGLRVHLYELVQKQDALAFLAGAHPLCDYVILLCHGWPDPNGVPQLNIKVIDQMDGDYSKSRNWETQYISLTPANIPDIVQGRGRTLICDACGSGRESLAQAFFQAGYKAYIAPRGPGVYGNAAVLFVIGFFYHLMAATRLDAEPFYHTDQEAVLLAAGIDANYTQGTRAFHYFSPTV